MILLDQIALAGGETRCEQNAHGDSMHRKTHFVHDFG